MRFSLFSFIAAVTLSVMVLLTFAETDANAQAGRRVGVGRVGAGLGGRGLLGRRGGFGIGGFGLGLGLGLFNPVVAAPVIVNTPAVGVQVGGFGVGLERRGAFGRRFVNSQVLGHNRGLLNALNTFTSPTVGIANASYLSAGAAYVNSPPVVSAPIIQQFQIPTTGQLIMPQTVQAVQAPSVAVQAAPSCGTSSAVFGAPAFATPAYGVGAVFATPSYLAIPNAHARFSLRY